MSNRKTSGATAAAKTDRRNRADPAPLPIGEDFDEVEGSGRRDRFPPKRLAELGRSGGETGDGHVTADDLSPATLLDDDPSHSPAVRSPRTPNDAQLRETASAAGLGTGLDEAELADREPVGREEADRLKRRSKAHAHDARYMEPANAEEAARRRQSERRH